MRVLLLGASGLIGRAIQTQAECVGSVELLPASHRKLPGYLHVDYGACDSAQRWLDLLSAHRIDAVIHCVGIWAATADEFDHIHYTVPVALFDACMQLGMRIIHLSALGFEPDSPLPYVATKARAERNLLAHCATGIAVCPSIVFGSQGRSSRFFLNLAALPLAVDFGLPRNLQPVHVRDVACAVVEALCHAHPAHRIECTGTHPISMPEYFAALRAGMGLAPVRVKLTLPPWCGELLFDAGQRMGAHFVNRQSWQLLRAGTQSGQTNAGALPYDKFATQADWRMTQETRIYWFARLGLAFLWLWTAAVTFFIWPHTLSQAWMDSLWPGLGTPFWLAASCVLDAAMGLAALAWPRQRLWLGQFALTALYTLGLALALPWSWSHPLGPLTKNLAVMAVMLYLAQQESARGR